MKQFKVSHKSFTKDLPKVDTLISSDDEIDLIATVKGEVLIKVKNDNYTGDANLGGVARFAAIEQGDGIVDFVSDAFKSFYEDLFPKNIQFATLTISLDNKNYDLFITLPKDISGNVRIGNLDREAEDLFRMHRNDVSISLKIGNKNFDVDFNDNFYFISPKNSGVKIVEVVEGENLGGEGKFVLLSESGNFEVNSGDFNDEIFLENQNANNLVNSGAGNDKIEIINKNSKNIINSGDGDDNIYNFSNQLKGQTNEIKAGNGNDTIKINAVDSENGKDIVKNDIYGEDGDDNIIYRSEIANSKASINGGNGNDVIDVIAENGANVAIFGGNGNDKISVTSLTANAAIQIFAGNGNDEIVGGAAKDIIRAGGGNDKITGGLGSDEIWGGDGRDVFVYNSADESNENSFDMIRDFQKGRDKIQITNSSFKNIGLEESSSDLYSYTKQEADGKFYTFIEDRYGDFKIALEGKIDLSNSDFIFA